MARKNNAEGNENDSNESTVERRGFRQYKSDTGKFYELVEGESIEGVLIAVRTQRIKDKRTKNWKDILVYRIRLNETDQLISLGGRTLLDRQMQDARDDMFGGDWNNMRNAEIVINRGEDTRTSEGNPLGSYEVFIKDSNPTE